MGRVSLEQLVKTIDDTIAREQEEAKKKIYDIVVRAKKDDPQFFEIPFNPFSDESEFESDEEEEEEEEKSGKWFSSLKASSSPTAKEILKIRKELYKKVQIALDDFKQYTSPLTTISPTSVFASLYCRLLQLEHIV